MRNLKDLFQQIGFFQSAPMAMSDCFTEKDTTFTRKLSGFARTLNSCLPEKIDGLFGTTIDLAEEVRIRGGGRIEKAAIYKLYPDIIDAGFEKAVMLQILRKNNEVLRYPELVSMREVVEAAATTKKALARGVNSGKGRNELKKSVISGMDSMLSAQGQAIIPAQHLLALQNIALQNYFAGDQKAGQVLKYYIADLNQLELPQ